MILVALGLIIGSFCNVLIWRLNDEKAPKWWQGRSICPHCKKNIAWFDNIPLLSFLVLNGKCRHCRKKISWQYPIVELASAIIFLLIGWKPGLLVIASSFIVIFVSDWIYGLIPDEMIVLGVLFSSFSNWRTALLSGLFFLAIVVATKFRGMGLGDVKLAFLIGLLLGWPKTAIAFWAAFVFGGVVAVILLVLKRVGFRDRIAFGPYLVLGTVFSALWSKYLLSAIPWLNW